MVNRRKIEAEQKWAVILKAWRHSGLRAAAYCRQEGINPFVFYRWKNRLGEGGGGRARRRGAFLPVKVMAPLAENPMGRPWVELGLCNGRTLRLWREISPEALGDMARVLEQESC